MGPPAEPQESQIERVVSRSLSVLDDLLAEDEVEASPASFDDWFTTFQTEQDRHHVAAFRNPKTRRMVSDTIARKRAEAANFVNSKAPKPASAKPAQSLATKGVPAPSKAPVSAPGPSHPLDKGAHTTPTPTKSTGKRRHHVDEYRLAEWHVEIEKHGTAYTFTGNPSDAILAKLDTKPEPLDWLRRRFAQKIKDAIGYVPTHFLAAGIESASGPRFHVHGVLALRSPEDLPAVRLAWRHAVGISNDRAFRARQVKIEPVDPRRARRWDVYCEKNAAEAKAAGVPGKLIVASGEVKSAATASKTTKKKATDKKAAPAREDEKSLINDVSFEDISKTEEKPLATDTGLTHRDLPSAYAHLENPNEDHDTAGNEDASRRFGRGRVHERARPQRSRGSERYADCLGGMRRRLDWPGRDRSCRRLKALASACARLS